MVTTRPLSRSLCRSLSRALVWLNDLAHATRLVDPAGADNSVLYTAKAAGAAGELISIEYAAPATQATTTVAVVGNAITVTPGTKARMVVTGTLTRDGSTPVVTGEMLNYDHTNDGKPVYNDFVGSYINISWSNYDSQWTIFLPPFIGGASWVSIGSPVATPDLVVTWVPVSPATGIPTVTALTSSASNVIRAINNHVLAPSENASPEAAALVTASDSGPSTGPVAQVAAAFLSLSSIPANALTLDGIALTLAGETLTLD